jgi:hypothetical protein
MAALTPRGVGFPSGGMQRDAVVAVADPATSALAADTLVRFDVSVWLPRVSAPLVSGRGHGTYATGVRVYARPVKLCIPGETSPR